MTTPTLIELRKLAQAACHPVTKGRWMRLFGDRTVYDRTEDGCRGQAIVRADVAYSAQDAKHLDFIAAANPAKVIELLDALEAQAAEIEALKQECFDLTRLAKAKTIDKAAMKGERDALRAELATAKYNVDVWYELFMVTAKRAHQLQAELAALKAQPSPVAQEVGSTQQNGER
jgi:hypothetical protein